MRISDLIRKLEIAEKKYVTSSEIKEFCKIGKFDYDTVVQYLVEQKYLVRIFRGIFYVRPHYYKKYDEHNSLELVANGLEIKGVENWYYGLHTALKINNMTHEYFVIEDVLSDTVFRQKPIKVNDHKFRFVKISKNLFSFGIKKHGTIKYSDPEKTILDFVYLGKYNGKSDMRIIMDVSEWSEKTSEKKLKKYAKHYPKSIQKIIEEIIHAR